MCSFNIFLDPSDCRPTRTRKRDEPRDSLFSSQRARGWRFVFAVTHSHICCPQAIIKCVWQILIICPKSAIGIRQKLLNPFRKALHRQTIWYVCPVFIWYHVRFPLQVGATPQPYRCKIEAAVRVVRLCVIFAPSNPHHWPPMSEAKPHEPRGWSTY